MGDQSTIKVLNSIYGLLQQVVRNQSQSTTNKQDNKNQRTVSDLNKGSLSNTNINNSSSSDIPKGKISVADVNALSGVPSVVLAIAGLNGRTMRNFNSVMNSLIQTITSFSKLDKTTTDGLKGIESLANGLDKLANARLVKLGISLAIVNATGIGKNFGKFVTEISSAINDKTIPDEKKITAVTEFITKVTPNIRKLALMAPLMPMFVLSAKMMSPGIKAYAKSIETLNNIKDPENAAKILKEMNTLVKSSVVLLGSTVAIGIAIKKVGAKEIFEGLAVNAGIILAVSGLAIAVAKAGSIMGRRSRKALDSISEFVGETMVVTSGIVLLSVTAGARVDQIKAGLPLVAGIFLGVSAIAITIGIVGTRINRRGRRGIRSITNFAASMILVTGALVLLSTIVTSSNDAIKNSFVLLGGVILATGALALVAAGVGLIITVARPLTNQVLKIAAFGIALTLGTVLLGSVLQQGWPLLTYGIAGTSAVILAYGAAVLIPALTLGLVAKAGAPLMLEFMKIAAFGLAVTLGTILVGYVLKEDIESNGLLNSGVWYGTLGVGAVILAYTSIITGATRIASAFNKGGQAALLDVMKMIGLGLVVTAGTIAVGKYLTANWKEAIFGFVGLTAIITEAVIVSRLATTSRGTIDRGSIDYKSVMLLMGSGVLILGGIVGIAALIKTLSPNGDFWSGFGYVGAVFGLFTAIITGAALLSRLATRTQASIRQGATSLLLSLGVIGASAAVLGAVLVLSDKLKESDTVAVIGTFAIMSGIVVGAGALATVASKIPKASIVNGLLTIGAIELLIVGSSLALYSIIKVTDAFKTLGDGDLKKGRQQAAGTILAMTGMLGYFGALAAAATFALPAVIGGVAAMALMDVFALGLSLFTATVIKTVNRASELGENPQQEIKKITKVLKAFGDVAGVAALGIPTWILGSAGFAAMLPMILSMSVASLAIIGVKNQIQKAGIENVSELGEFAKSLSSIFTFDNFKLPLNAIQRIRLLAQYSDMKPVFKGLSGMADGVSKLVMSVGGMDGNGNIIPIVGHDSSGKPIYGKPVDMPRVARSIVDAVTIFSGILSTDLAKLSSKDNKNLLKSFESLSTILEPISNFADALSSFESGGPGKIRAIRFDEKGIQINTPFVDVIAVAGTIGNAVKSFVEVLFGQDTAQAWITAMSSGYEVIKSKNGKKVLGEKRANAEVAMGVLSLILDPVSNFVDTLTKFEQGDAETIVVPVYDKDGNITSTRKVNISNIAKLIAGAVSTFANELFGPTAAKGWIDTITGGAEYVQTKNDVTYKESNAQKAMGSLGALITPIVSFANMLSMFGEKAGENKLLVYSADGKYHIVDLIATARSIASALTTFISTLSSGIKTDVTQQDMDLLKNNIESISSLFSSFGNDISAISNINSKEFDANVNSVSKVLDMLFSKGNAEYSSSINLLSTDLTTLNTPLSTFISTFVQIPANDIGGNVEKFAKALSGLSSSITDIKTVIAESNTDNINKFIKDLFGSSSFAPEDFAGLDTVVEKFKAYDDLLKSISTIQISNATLFSLSNSVIQLITFGKFVSILSRDSKDIDISPVNSLLINYKSILNNTDTLISGSSTRTISRAIELSESIKEFLNSFIDGANIVNRNIASIIVFNLQKSNIVSFLQSLVISDIDKIDVRSLNRISSQLVPIFTKFVQVAEAINTESVNALDVNSKGIISFVNNISDVFGNNFNVDGNNINVFTNSFKKLLSTIVKLSSDDIHKSSENITEIKNSFVSFNDTIDYLITSDLSAATSVDTFQKAIDSLFVNISSFADKKNIGKLDTVQKSITATTKSLVSLDNTFLKKNKDRLSELRKLNDSLQELTKNFGESKDGITKLTDLISALNKSDKDKVESILGEISRAHTPARSTGSSGEGGGVIGKLLKGDGEKKETAQTGGISYDELVSALSTAVETAINNAFDDARIRIPNIKVGDTEIITTDMIINTNGDTLSNTTWEKK